MTAGNWMQEETFEVVMDPRVVQQGVTETDIKEQLSFQRQVITLLSEARRFEDALEKEAKSLKKKRSKSKKERLQLVNSVLEELKNDEGAYPQQMLVAQIGYLYYMLNGADQLPGADARARLSELRTQLNALKERMAN